MTETELYTLLSGISTTLPVAYDHFDSKVSTPFILYRNTSTNTFKADDVTYYSANEYIVDLVSDKKDKTLEELVEQAFNTNHLPFDKEETYFDDERIYQIRYFI